MGEVLAGEGKRGERESVMLRCPLTWRHVDVMSGHR